MSLALGLRQTLSRGRTIGRTRSSSSVCLITQQQRRESTATTTPFATAAESTDATPAVLSDPRRDLENALQSLQTYAPNYVNLARVQLALRNLKQQPGRESIRVAFLGLPNVSEPGRTAKRLLRLVLADPLKPLGDWETQLEAHDVSQPLIVRVGPVADSGVQGESGHMFSMEKEHVIPELKVSSPSLNAGNLEMVITDADELVAAAKVDGPLALEDAILVPTVDIAAPKLTQPTHIATPVHMALLVGDGVLGAASILSLPLLGGTDTIASAVNFKKLSTEDLAGCPLVKINVDAGSDGLGLFRDSVGNAMKFEALWTEANVGRIGEWLKSNVLPSGEEGTATTKAPVRHLIRSLLQNADAAIQAQEARDLSLSITGTVAPQSLAQLNQGLSEWAQNAHEELQQQLEIAFTDRPWRRLGWWKLFWRVDDVGMLSSEMLALRFLPEAERGIIYLAGRIREAGVIEGQTAGHPSYSGPVPPPPTLGGGQPQLDNTNASGAVVAKWPEHIPFTRNYLQDKTVPALQALAQKLVLQSLTTGTVTIVLAGLSYLSAYGAYECGAIAALGIIWSLRRLQKKWDAAREFWEGEVLEEGRKAVRASEVSIAEVLNRATKSRGDQFELLDELTKAREIIQRAEEALARLK
ncbi:hypothetical protein B0H63DRAFT_398165 [Podospora didyma]|uniref:Mmc1 C-terminal domain-containing protein n=1 Tax=Podospora didyma TaxID=330526 RepID=A0AAE0KKC0_9PEZI|nr:hypothetical protein B0H63DRAFT_398165 [Podospora didyma]